MNAVVAPVAHGSGKPPRAARWPSAPTGVSARRPLLALMLLLIAPVVGAWVYPPGQNPAQPPAGYGQPQSPQWQFRPQPPSNAQGTPPTYQPGMPGQMYMQPPGYAPYPGQPPPQYLYQYPGQAQRVTTRLEATFDESEPYLQQPLLLRLQLISSDNPSEANLELPSTGDALLQRLDGPTPDSRLNSEGKRELVNRFILMLVPLRSGPLEIPSIKVTGKMRGHGGVSQRYEAATDQPLRLNVRPAVSAVTPWLPLRSLDLQARIDQEESLAPGQPLTLALELSAIGATAAQLPSLEDQLSGPDVRVYREQVLTEGGLSPDGRHLFGRRTEYYTLVPQSPGRLVLPELSIAWWNTDLGVREVARLPMRTLSIRGDGGFIGESVRAVSGDGSGLFWLPLGALLLLMVGYWGGVLLNTRPGARARDTAMGGFTRRLRPLARATARRLGHGIRQLDPSPLLARARTAAIGALPASSRFLRCVRDANQASNPLDWSARFVTGARSRLRFQGEASQPSLIKLIIELRPGADPVVLSRLMQELDGVLYGRQDLDFARWKQDFQRQVGRGSGIWRRLARGSRIKRAALPALNPDV